MADISVTEDHRQAFKSWTGRETYRFRLISWCCNEVQDPPLAVSLAVYCSPRGYHSVLKLSAETLIPRLRQFGRQYGLRRP